MEKNALCNQRKGEKKPRLIPFYYVIEIYKVMYIIVSRYVKRGIFLFHSVRQCNFCCATCLHRQGSHPLCQVISGFVHEKYVEKRE